MLWDCGVSLGQGHGRQVEIHPGDFVEAFNTLEAEEGDRACPRWIQGVGSIVTRTSTPPGRKSGAQDLHSSPITSSSQEMVATACSALESPTHHEEGDGPGPELHRKLCIALPEAKVPPNLHEEAISPGSGYKVFRTFHVWLGTINRSPTSARLDAPPHRRVCPVQNTHFPHTPHVVGHPPYCRPPSCSGAWTSCPVACSRCPDRPPSWRRQSRWTWRCPWPRH